VLHSVRATLGSAVCLGGSFVGVYRVVDRVKGRGVGGVYCWRVFRIASYSLVVSSYETLSK